MKTITIVLIIITALSCRKKDTINHYLNKPVTEQELIDNGFYKYSFTYTNIYDYEENGNKDAISEAKYKDSLKTFGKVTKEVLYTNVKPHKREDGKICPTFLFKAYDDMEEEKERINYLENELEHRVISYLFVNDKLNYKSVLVYPLLKNKKDIPDLSTFKKITHFYDSLNIPIVPILEGKRSTKKHITLFYINNYKTSIYYAGDDRPSYDILTNYIDNKTPRGDDYFEWFDRGQYEFEK